MLLNPVVSNITNTLQLSNDISVLNGELSTDDIIHAGGSGYIDELAHSIDVQSKQRLYLACYILDQQHATLFGRQRTNAFPWSGMDLPFPKRQSSWDARRESHVQEETARLRVWQAIDRGHLDETGQTSYDVFQSMLMMGCLGDGAEFESPDYSTHTTGDFPPTLGTMEQSPRIKMAYHTFQLCKHTPIRDLLAVAGESWVMAEKLGSQADYTAAQIEGRHWARGFMDSTIDFNIDTEQAPVNRAVRHALRILELHLNHPKTGLLFQEWSVYLASVVVWARAYVTADPTQLGPRLTVPNPAEPRPSPHELDQSVSAIIASGPNSHVVIDQAKTILLWAKARIETVDIPHNCGLTNGALDVLGKLISRGTEEGWFGS